MTSNNRIHSLPLQLANQIAAGEVIDRPASIIKELVENSIDAGASKIEINIEGAGSKLIRVNDNGIGIHPEDLLLAISRHATSKLHSSEQLSHISSLGFRGEALPSIASVSKLILTSRQHNNDTGWQLNGNTNAIIPSAHPLGSTVEVRDLFFNIPARRRFLRSDKTEQHHLLTTIHRLALSQFKIGFQYSLASSLVKLPAAITAEQQQKRLAKICGNKFINNSLFIQQKYDDIELEGWLGKVSAHRPQTDVQYFFINGRVIRDRVIMHAIRQAYGDLIPSGRQPAYVLYLKLPLDRVDINVHPTKHEVRFRDARLIHGLITSALQEALISGLEERHHQTANASSSLLLSEQASTYQTAHQSQPTANISAEMLASAKSINTAHTILLQRYIIHQTQTHPQLIDLQQADRQLRQQQLVDALQSNSLKARPILVPISINIDEESAMLVNKYAATLAHLCIEVALDDHRLIIKQIPALLSQVNVRDFITTILSALANKQTSIKQLGDILRQQIPYIPILNSVQANQILQQTSPHIEADWCIQLDQKTLNGLFSA